MNVEGLWEKDRDPKNSMLSAGSTRSRIVALAKCCIALAATTGEMLGVQAKVGSFQVSFALAGKIPAPYKISTSA